MNINNIILFLLAFLLAGNTYGQCENMMTPSNDDPCITSENPPLDLTETGSHQGTTCCARGPLDTNPDGSFADFGSIACAVTNDEAAVWYMFTPDAANEGYDLMFTTSAITSTVEIYFGQEEQGCNTGFTEENLIGSICNKVEAIINIPNCFAADDNIFVKVSSKSDPCVDFEISIQPGTCNLSPNTCLESMLSEAINPVTPIDVGLTSYALKAV